MSTDPGADLGRLLVTGANGHLGRRLLTRLAHDGIDCCAVVRSEQAAGTLRALPEDARPDVEIVSYTDAAGLERAAQGCAGIVHLVGILKESKRSRYADAHERATEAVARAAAAVGARRVVYASILASEPSATNACLASKGRAERLLLDHEVPATVLRLPMVLGEGDAASRALRGQALARVLPLVGGGASLEQPMDARDVIEAILAALQRPGSESDAFDLAGPESLSHRELVGRAAALWDRRPFVVPIPLALARAVVRTVERFAPDPPITEAMLEVLMHDDRIDTEKACEALRLTLTPLDETLRRCVGPEAA